MTILITGANGFIGRTLHERLLKKGYSVRGAVRRHDRTLIAERDLVYLDASLESCDWSEALISVDTVVHTAARVHILKETSEDPDAEFYAINVVGTMNLARQAADSGVRRFVFVSSIGVHGACWKAPIREDSPLNPETPYAKSKLCAEQALERFCRGAGLELVIIRPPLVFGAGAPGNIQRLAKLVRSGLPLPFKGVSNRRSIVSLTNLCAFIELCVTRPEAAGEVFLIADYDPVSTPALVEYIAAGLGRPARLFFFPTTVARWAFYLLGQSGLYAQLFCSLEVDDAKARRELGWSDEIATAEALREAAGSAVPSR